MTTWYAHTVDHYFRITFKPPKQLSTNAEKWITAVKEWFKDLSKKDREFLTAVFTVDSCFVSWAVQSLPGDTNQHWRTLNRLERDFARFSGLL